MDDNIISNIAAFTDDHTFTKMVKAFGSNLYYMMKDLEYVEEIDMTGKYGVFEIFVEVKDWEAIFKLIGDCTWYEEASAFEAHYKNLLDPWLANKNTKGSCLMTTLRLKYASITAGYVASTIIVFTNKMRFLSVLNSFIELEKTGKIRLNTDFGVRIPLQHYVPPSAYYFTIVRLFRNKYVIVDYIFKCTWLYSSGISYINIPIDKVRKFLYKKVS